MHINDKKIKQTALELIAAEAAEISALSQLIDEVFVHACRLILSTKGRLVVMGMGKSGHIGGKIAATLASTGTPAFFVHPAEALHGDLGMITADDAVLLLSYSGETQELVALLSCLKRLEVPIIAISGSAESTLAQHADAALVLNISKEACPHNLAPTSSSSATLALGDALAIALLEQRSFSREDFAQVHPGGSLGKRLLTVEKLMHCGDRLPIVDETANLAATLTETSAKKLGVCFIVDAKQNILGLFTDGDLRRTMQQQQLDTNTAIIDLMTKNSISVSPQLLAVDALTLMEKKQITVLAVIDEKKQLLGVLHMHDLLQAKIT